MKVRDVVRLLMDDGWIQVSQKGSHRQFEHGIKAGQSNRSRQDVR